MASEYKIKIKCSHLVSSAPIFILSNLIKEESNIDIEWGDLTSSEIISIGGKEANFSSVNSICRFLARISTYNLYGKTKLEKTEVDHWMEYCKKCTASEFKDCLEKLNRSLSLVTYLVGDAITLADICVWTMLYGNKQFNSMLTNNVVPENLNRWYKFVSSNAAFQSAINMFPQEYMNGNEVPTKDKVKTADRGKFTDLPGAEMGKVIVRFPPEASGYLHIGHAKAALLNAHYQVNFKGKLILRFDDTNPEKEKEDFEKVILEDVAMLEIKPDAFTFTSDHFITLLEKCEFVLKSGLAFVDDTDPELMKNEREQRVDSKNRGNAFDKNWSMWEEMKKGTDYGKSCCVRAKIDMKSDNGCLRDPTLYRCKSMSHPRTGNKYNVYPTYDFACPIVDSIEGVTHALRTTEYHDRDDQYFWILDALKLRKPYIYEYSRLNMTNTVLSKRKLTWFVQQGIVDGWDDPRMPTVRGILRRGLTVDGLKQFIVAQGSSRSVVVMEWDKIWAFNKKVIDPIAPRYCAVEKDNCVTVIVEGVAYTNLTVAKHPKNSELGTKDMHVGPKLLVDRADAELMKVGENVTFINWGNLLVTDIKRNDLGEVVLVTTKLNLDNKDYKKTLKITWVLDDTAQPLTPCKCVYFDHLISKPVLGKDEEFKDFLNENTKTEVQMLGDSLLKTLKKGDIIQIQRKGFFICDDPYDSSSLRYTSREGHLVLFAIPDGSKDVTSLPLVVRKIQEAKLSDKERSSSMKGKAAEKSPKEEEKSICGSEVDLDSQIQTQGDKIRNLKDKKAEKSLIQSEVQQLLKLKADYKNVTGKDWKPGASKSESLNSTTMSNSSILSSKDVCDIDSRIKAQGNTVRQLKSEKADKSTIDAAVQQLLMLKEEFKKCSNMQWKPDIIKDNTNNESFVKQSTPPSNVSVLSSKEVCDIDSRIRAQGNIVRQLKSEKADKNVIDAAVKQLLKLKEEFKNCSNMQWKPDIIKDNTNNESFDKQNVSLTSTPPSNSSILSSKDVCDIDSRIKAQGNIVRQLKSEKADKSAIDAAVQQLLMLKEEFKKCSNMQWKPDIIKDNTNKESFDKQNVLLTSTPPSNVSVLSSKEVCDIDSRIRAQGNIVRQLKSEKADKNVIDAAVKQLLKLKEEFKNCSNMQWKPDLIKNACNDESCDKQSESNSVGELFQLINAQGNIVRKLKSEKADKSVIDENVKQLLKLKENYKSLSGCDWKPDADPKRAVLNPNSGNPESPIQGCNKQSKGIIGSNEGNVKTVTDNESNIKKITRLGLEVKKEDNLAEWYSQVLTKGEMIEYYDVSGCYILRPWAYSIWEVIQKFFDSSIKSLGVMNCYFPMFVTSNALEKEKTHLSDFAPEVAWVTKSGDSDLDKAIAIRPTSETVMYPSYAKWIRSHRDLPLRLNQWCNVVRWEFRNPQPFIRTREFLWQEGHTAFATKEEAENEVFTILDLYAQVYENLLAIPVIKGKKTEKEKFAGADFTTTTEAYVAENGRGIQGATSHHLGQNFSKMFEIVYEDPETNEKQFVYQNSWGLTTRTIGAMVLIHGDNTGLVLPPRVACYQVVIVPCGVTASLKESDKDHLYNKCSELQLVLEKASIPVKVDFRDNYSPGWKFNYWELKGVPIRIELGPKDMKKNQFVAVRRDTGEKSSLGIDSAPDSILELLDNIHDNLYGRAKKKLEDHLCVCYDWLDFCNKLDNRFIIQSPFCGDISCEDNIKKDSARNADENLEPGAPSMGAKSLCIPFMQPEELKPDTKCIHPKCTQKPKCFTLFGRSY